jgi:hypothetical protein
MGPPCLDPGDVIGRVLDGDVQVASSLTMTILDAGELFRDLTARSILDFSRGLFESVLRARLEPLDRVAFRARPPCEHRRASGTGEPAETLRAEHRADSRCQFLLRR